MRVTKLTKHIGVQPDKYYGIANILKMHALYNMIIGKRSDGKTYAIQYRALKRFCDHDGDGYAMAVIRRWATDFTGKTGSAYFNGLVSDGWVEKLSDGKWTNIRYWSNRWWLCTTDDHGKLVTDSKPFAYAMCLNTWEHDKGPSYPDIKTIMFDEFLSSAANYLPNEFMCFMNVVSTIVRQRNDLDDFEIYMLGNTVSQSCPYFAEMGISNIRKQPMGTIDTYEFGDTGNKVAVEYIHDREDIKSNPANKYFAFNNPKLAMITGGLWEFGSYPHCPVKYEQSDVLFRYFIKYEDEVFQANIISVDDNLFTFIHRKTTVIKYEERYLIYSLDYNPALNYRRNIFAPHTQAEKKIGWMFKVDRVYYQDNSVGEDIHNFLVESSRS